LQSRNFSFLNANRSSGFPNVT